MDELKKLPEKHFQACITSPPYYKQRSYLPKDHPLKNLELGQEKNPYDYIEKLVTGFSEVRRVLRADGTLWVVIDDKIINGQPGGLPWRFVLAMQDDGWHFIEDIIWNKPNPTPQSVKKKMTHSHEYIFHFSKSLNYQHDREAIRTPYAASTVPRQMRAVSGHHKHTNGAPGQPPHSMSQPRLNVREIYNGENTKEYATNGAQLPSDTKRRILESLMKYSGANKKSVWTVPKGSFKGLHFATFPPKLIEPCVLASSKPGDEILDCFGGSGTTAMVCKQHGRNSTSLDINADYVPIMESRIGFTSHTETPALSPSPQSS